MPRKEFSGATLEEVRRAVESWKRDHVEVTVTKEWPPVELLYGGTHFLSKEQGPGQLMGVMIVIDYEDLNSGPARPSPERAET
jgi:hypothetical protein